MRKNKLAFKRETLRSLTSEDLGRAGGGDVYTGGNVSAGYVLGGTRPPNPTSFTTQTSLTNALQAAAIRNAAVAIVR